MEVDGFNINTNLSEWYKKIGYVPQSVYLTDDTIRKNIAFGLREDNINDDLIKQAVEKASLNEFLNSLSRGLETVVGEKGIRLSGGQQQRVALARAIIRNPKVFLISRFLHEKQNGRVFFLLYPYRPIVAENSIYTIPK